jgi:hypothetical protein
MGEPILLGALCVDGAGLMPHGKKMRVEQLDSAAMGDLSLDTRAPLWLGWSERSVVSSAHENQIAGQNYSTNRNRFVPPRIPRLVTAAMGLGNFEDHRVVPNSVVPLNDAWHAAWSDFAALVRKADDQLGRVLTSTDLLDVKLKFGLSFSYAKLAPLYRRKAASAGINVRLTQPLNLPREFW